MALTLNYVTHSEVGLVRKNNQDSAYASPTMLMVADGMGGAAAGDLASAVAVHELKRTDDTLTELLHEAAQERLDAAAERPASDDPEATLEHADRLVDEATDAFTVLEDTLARANEKLAALVDADAQLEGMGTTVCGFIKQGDTAAVVNIGDSRAYRLRNGHLRRLTRDHSWVQTLIDEGRISEEEALEHPHRSLILRVLNGSPVHEADYHTEKLRAGDRFLICSDGLCGLVTDAQIAQHVGVPDREAALAELVALAHAAGGHDNITIIIADVEEDGPEGTPVVLGAASTVRIPETENTAELDLGEGDLRPLSEEDRYALRSRRSSLWLKALLGVLVPVLVLAGGGWAWWSYAQSLFYVGASRAGADELVTVYRGVPDAPLGLPLNRVVRVGETKLSDLPPYYAEQVRSTIPVADEAAADSTLAELAEKSKQCIAQREARARATATPTPTPSPSVSGTPTPGAIATPAATPAPEATASASATPGATPGTTASPSVSPSPEVTPDPSLPPQEC